MTDNPATSRKIIESEQRPGTALITGASSGLGESFGCRLASLGYNLILVARREDRLRELAAEWMAKHGIHVEVEAADLSRDEDIIRVEGRIRARTDLTLLVNNAGFGAGGAFQRIDIEKQADMIHVHVVATARLLGAVLPQMVERGRGGVINVASVAAFAIMPNSAMYGSTKSWVVAFSRAVALGLRGTGVRVQALCPGFTVTGFHETPEYKNFKRAEIPRFLWMKADDVVAASLKALEKREKAVFIPGLVNKVMALIPRLPFGAALGRRQARKRG
jgi:hypothetical protein